MTRQQILAEIFRRAEALDLSRKTRKLALSPRGQRLIVSVYELERRRLTRGTWAPTALSPAGGEMNLVLAVAEQLAWKHHQAAKEAKA